MAYQFQTQWPEKKIHLRAKTIQICQIFLATGFETGTLISLINVEVGMNLKGLQKMQNQ